MKMEVPESAAEERTRLVLTLLSIIDQQQQRIARLEELVQQLREEIAILKGQKPRPQSAPSGLESPRRQPPAEGEKRPGSEKRSKNAQLKIDQEMVLKFPDPPPGAVSLGYEEFTVQELIIRTQTTRYWRGSTALPERATPTVPLPAQGVIP